MSVTSLADAWAYNGNDAGIVLFTEALKAWRFDLPAGARVLELGCCESNWAEVLVSARPDVKVTGIDVRPCPGYPGEFIQGDAADWDWDNRWFEAIVGIGSIEHFGLGFHEYGDPVNPVGDYDALLLAEYTLTPNGLIYYDVPWTPHAMFQTEHWRCYDEDMIAARLVPNGHVERARGWALDGNERAFTQVRPVVPHSPFYFTARWLTKVA